MSKVIINTSNAPAPIGPYSQAVKAGNMLFVSGQIAMDAQGNLVMESVQAETHQAMKNIASVLSKAGAGFEHIVKTTIFLTDMALFSEVNEVYGSYFTSNFPARETVAVKGLPRNVNVEISVTAVVL
jgi:2-iminobutanoate/2-iminopropanoate deaminase